MFQEEVIDSLFDLYVLESHFQNRKNNDYTFLLNIVDKII
jgi:hypothetical protein